MCVQLSMWINGDWHVAESGWCRVINQHNECRWALCRWSPHSGLCHPAGSLSAPLQCFCMALAVFLGHVSLASLFNLWARFCMILFYDRLTLISPGRLAKYTTFIQMKKKDPSVGFTFLTKWWLAMLCIFIKQEFVLCRCENQRGKPLCPSNTRAEFIAFFFFTRSECHPSNCVAWKVWLHITSFERFHRKKE